MLLDNQCVKEETKREMKIYTETNENVNKTYQNIWDAAKVQRGKFIVIKAQSKEKERSQTKTITSFQFKELEKEEQTMPKGRRKKKIIKIKTEINEIENRKTR